MKALIPLLLLLGLLPLPAAESIVQDLAAEVVVYGATSGGVPAAVAAAREGRSVILVEPSRWLGGLLGSGFRISEDVPFAETLGGLARRWLDEDLTWGDGGHDWKATANQQWCQRMIDPYRERIRIIYEHRVRRVLSADGRISALVLEHAPPDGRGVPAPAAASDALMRIAGQVFIDASYEGDVMAKAGVSYRVGRESAAEYGESLAGVCGVHAFPGVSPYVRAGDPASGLLPMIDPEPLGELGSANRPSMATTSSSAGTTKAPALPWSRPPPPIPPWTSCCAGFAPPATLSPGPTTTTSAGNWSPAASPVCRAAIPMAIGRPGRGSGAPSWTTTCG